MPLHGKRSPLRTITRRRAGEGDWKKAGGENVKYAEEEYQEPTTPDTSGDAGERKKET